MPLARRLRTAIPYALLVALTLPIVIGYVWLFISTFAYRTYGLIPEGFTLQNWDFLREVGGCSDAAVIGDACKWLLANGVLIEKKSALGNIWIVTFNTLILALALTAFDVLVSCMAGYALSRLQFPGRKGFLSMTLILHAFPSVTLLIAIFYVLRTIGLYDTILGVALVMISLQLPLGIWLMKGFFDNVSWDVERAALIDGCSRFRTWREVILPNIKPGIAALSIFAFLSGWGEFLIPFTFTISPNKGTIAVYLRHLLGNAEFVNYGELAAVGLFQLIPVMIFFIFTQEYLLNIYTGGVKGGA